nr:hypothetical protein [Desulfobacterales bacterium]
MNLGSFMGLITLIRIRVYSLKQRLSETEAMQRRKTLFGAEHFIIFVIDWHIMLNSVHLQMIQIS